MAKYIIKRVSEISWHELTLVDHKATRQEEIDNRMNVVIRHFGDSGEGEIKTLTACTHEVFLFKDDLPHHNYPMILGHEAVHQVTRVDQGIKYQKGENYCATY